MQRATRRRILEGVALASAVSAAGCLGDSDEEPESADPAEPNGDGTGTDESTTAAESDSDATAATAAAAAPSTWLPGTGVVDYEAPFGFGRVHLSSFREASEGLEDYLVQDVQDPPAAAASALGIAVEDLTALLAFPAGFVLSGDYDAGAVREAIEAAGYEARGEYGDYVVYDAVAVDPSVDRHPFEVADSAVAVGESAIVVADAAGTAIEGGETPTDAASIETLLDTARGETESLPETHAGVGAMVDALEETRVPVEASSTLHVKYYGAGMSETPDGTRGATASVAVGTDRVDLAVAFVFESTPNVDPIRSLVEDSSAYDPYETEVYASGRTVLVEGTANTTDLDWIPLVYEEFDRGGGDTRAGPQVGVTFDHDADADEVTVTVVAVDRADALEILVDDETVRRVDDVTAGDAFVIDVTDADRVAVVAEYEGKKTLVDSYDV